MSDTRKRLSDFLRKLIEGIEDQGIQSETDLDQVFRVESEAQAVLWKVRGIPKTDENATLLEILGYGVSNVEDHPVKKVVVGTIHYAPDYILKHQQRLLAIIDLKAPGVNLDHEKWMGQIYSYCRELKVPLGLLFNGREVRVFINTEVKGLTRYKDLFSSQPVAAASYHDQKQMAEILLRFAASSLQSDPIIVARTLANKRARELKDKQRQKRIQEQLRHLLANPTDELFALLSTLDGVWGDIEPNPSEAELVAAWRLRPLTANPVEPMPKGSINAKMRQTIAQVCKEKGWDFLKTKQINGLRYRQHGGNGYYLVPQSQGVPTDLYVQGVPSEDAKRITQQLEQLLVT